MHIKIAFDDGSGATRLESSEGLAGRHARIRQLMNRRLTHRTMPTQDFPGFSVLGESQATRTLPVVGRLGA